MSGVFLSYSRTDRALAEKVVRALRAIGVEVWWDQDMPGVDWQKELERQVTELTALIVLWSPASANSEYVRDEARLALSRHKLVNALCGVSSPPFPFDRINGLPIGDWNGRDSHGGWSRLVATLEEHLVRAGSAKPGQLTDALARRDAVLLDAQQQVAAAEEAFHEAKAREGETTEAAREARTAYDAAETQLQRVAEMRVSTVVLKAAQEELDARRVAMEAADTERRSAAAQLSAASRAVTRVKADLARLYDEPTPPDAGGATQPQAETRSEPKPEPKPEPEVLKEEPAKTTRADQAARDLTQGASLAGETQPQAEAETKTEDQPKAEETPKAEEQPKAKDELKSEDQTKTQGQGDGKKRSNTPLIIAGAAAAALVSIVVVAALLSQSPSVVDYGLPGIPPVKVADTQLEIDTIKTNAKNADKPELADYWWAIGAEKGDAEAEYQLGYAYCFGKGVATRDDLALVWFQKSADQNYANAEEWVASYYEHGYGVTVDMVKARSWYEKAAAGGDSYAQTWLSQHPADTGSSDSSTSGSTETPSGSDASAQPSNGT